MIEIAVSVIVGGFSVLYFILKTLSPIPRKPFAQEWKYKTKENQEESFPHLINAPSKQQDLVQLSVVIPAFNEYERLPCMMSETLEYLDKRLDQDSQFSYEIIIVDDASKDKTSELGLEFQRKSKDYGTRKAIRVMTQAENRGKGGTVIQGLLASRGKYVLFADADGATKFSDVEKLELGIKSVESNGLGFAVGSRAHMVKTDAVVKRTLFRNILMRGFHFAVYVLGIGFIKDTQCGFKLLTRKACERIAPNMHVEGWIFDIEMLILAEANDVPIVEIPVTWHEVDGTKMSLLKDSIQMLVQLLMIRLNYFFGIWKSK